MDASVYFSSFGPQEGVAACVCGRMDETTTDARKTVGRQPEV